MYHLILQKQQMNETFTDTSKPIRNNSKIIPKKKYNDADYPQPLSPPRTISLPSSESEPSAPTSSHTTPYILYQEHDKNK